MRKVIKNDRDAVNAFVKQNPHYKKRVYAVESIIQNERIYHIRLRASGVLVGSVHENGFTEARFTGED